MHRLISNQLAKATDAVGNFNPDILLGLVSSAYQQFDKDRSRADRATRLMIAEVDELNRERTATLEALATQNKLLADFSANLEQRVAERTAAADAAADLARQARDHMVHEIEGRQRVEEEMRTQNRRFDVALKNMSHGLCMFDDQEQLVLSNSRYAEMYRMPPELLKPGTRYRDLMAYRITTGFMKGDSSPAALEAFLEQRARMPKDVVSSRVDEFHDGRLICITRHPMEGGGWVTTHLDITERERLNAGLQAANKAKSEFLATMSHEIRTPMNGVLGTLELVLDTALTSTQKMLTVTARDSAVGLLGILNDILDYSKLEAAKVELEVGSFSPEQVMDDVVSLFLPMATSKGLNIDLSIATGLPMWLAGDVTRVRQVLTNLVGNAIKFTSHGGVRVNSGFQLLEDGRTLVRFEVIDSGVGIPADAVERLFMRFTQSDNSTTRKFGGTGLGLAICKQIIDLMGGRIGVDAVASGGCRFWFEAAFVAGSQPVAFPVDEADQASCQPTRPFSILIADDNRVNRMIVQMMLTKQGHAVDTVVNGREAVEAVMRSTYDVVLMDVQMPEMDGPTATRAIRALVGPKRATKIIALTANAMPGHREEYLGAGMNDYVSKPIAGKVLFSVLNRVAAGPASDVAMLAKTAATAVTIGGTPAELMAVDDLHLQLPLVDSSVIAGWSHGMAATEVADALGFVPDESARSLNEIKNALAAGDLVEAKRIAHRLKGMAGSLGAVRLAAIARSIEIDARSIESAAQKIDMLEVAANETLKQLRLSA
jgi:signal transduction histidine kinase/DNA-binding NarL/FixJ family response regulator